MTIYSHIMVILKANVSELKARLSAYLAEVKDGRAVVVLERRTPIAKLVPIEKEGLLVVREARAPVSELGTIKGVRLKRAFDSVADVRADRDGR